MRIIISPAKKMNTDTDSLPVGSLPQFLPQTEKLLEKLKSMSYADLKKLWKCNDSIAELNFERIHHTDLRRSLTPAILSYEGIQYQHIAPGVFTQSELDYIQHHLRILSGFYGILKPFDGIAPYRLEMQAKLSMGESKDLYSFWGDKPASILCENAGTIINLASKEYSSCVARYIPASTAFITCTFAEEVGGKLLEKGTMCKIARGEMVRFMAENQLAEPADLKGFDRMNYSYSARYSKDNHFVFIRT